VSTFFAELSTLLILESTARTLHAACLLLWGLRGKERLSAHSVHLYSSASAQPLP